MSETSNGYVSGDAREEAASGGFQTGARDSPDGSFCPAWWLPGPHAQTLWAALARRPPVPALRPERLSLPDGDFLDLFWGPEKPGPVVLLLHGLSGSAQSGYMQAMVSNLARAGMQAVAMQYRGAGDEPNRKRRFYHAGEWEDPDFVIQTLRARHPGRAFGAVGFSLGGSILLNWLGNRGSRARPDVAVAVSVPFDLKRCAAAVDTGFARIYQSNMLGGLKAMYRRKFGDDAHPPVSLSDLSRMRSLRQFDDAITAPLHGFADADDYYHRCSCRPRLTAIATPALIINAIDDPFIPPDSLPSRNGLARSVELDVTPTGGHVAFVGGRIPGIGRYWAEQRALQFLAFHLTRDSG
jgi:predicted alpha/beta-fold hydrolase